MISEKQESFYFAVALVIISVMLLDFFVNVENPTISGNAVSSVNPACGNKILDTGEACDSGIIRGYSKIIFNCSDGKRYSTKGSCYYPNYLKEYATKICNSKKNSSPSLISYEFVDDCAIKTPVYCFQQSTAFLNKNSFIRCHYNNCTLDFSLCNTTGTCGNGILEPGEKCDGSTGILCRTLLPASNNPAASVSCTPSCNFDTAVCSLTVGRCGNGIKESGEDCDDGNNVTGDGCKNTCKYDCTINSDCGAETCIDNSTIQKNCQNHVCVLTRNCTLYSFCSDSDNGDYPDIHGSVSSISSFNGTNSSGTDYADFCYYNPDGEYNVSAINFRVSNCSGIHCGIFEYNCQDFNGSDFNDLFNVTYFDGMIHGYKGELGICNAVNDYACQDGACVNATNETTLSTCTDSDGGINIYQKGIITYPNNTIGYDSPFDAEQCGEGNGGLWETWCEWNAAYQLYNIFGQSFSCPNGCLDGACINTTNPIQSCSDSNLYNLTPYIMSWNQSSESIRFETNVPVNATIVLRSSSSTITYWNSSFSKKWEVLFNGLTPSTSYGYSISIMNSTSSSCVKNTTFSSSFTTSDDSDDTFSFAVLGDTRHGTDCGVTNTTYRIFQLLEDKDIDFVMITGDIIQGEGSGCSAKISDAWKDFHNSSMSVRARIPIIAAVGNHDVPRTTNGKVGWTNYWMLPMNGAGYSDEWKETTYYWRYGNSLFISLNDYESLKSYDIRGSQYDWLEDIALPLNGFTNKFVFTHIPFFGTTRADTLFQWNSTKAYILSSLMLNNGVDAAFYGHEHMLCLNKSADGLLNVITGGGGSPLHSFSTCKGIGESIYHYMIVNVSDTMVWGYAYDLAGNRLDGFLVNGTFSRVLNRTISAPTPPSLSISSNGGNITLSINQ